MRREDQIQVTAIISMTQVFLMNHRGMAIPDYHKLGGLTEIYSHGSRGQKFAIKMLAGLVPSGGCFMPHSSLLVADGSPWCSWASKCISPVSARLFTSFPSVS